MIALRGVILDTRDTLASRGLMHTKSDVTTIKVLHGICDTLTIRSLKSKKFDSLASAD